MNQRNLHIAEPAFATVPASRACPSPLQYSIDLKSAHAVGRQELEACVAGKFDEQHQARIQHFLPYLLSLGTSGRLGAVVGIRLAAESELFLERYLDSRVERAISRVVKAPVDRHQVVEIGNLAAAVPGSASLLFALLATVLDRAGIHWVVCTATPQVRSMLNRMQFPSHTICAAEAAALGSEAGDWGNYYACRPQVIVGDTRIAARAAACNPAMADLTAKLLAPVAQIAAALRAARQS
ncbi:MAG: thermostable hemolysin [Gammaproteobacteria bacterium]|nr:thermostable hemolysin [Gammaproteobacteria bacterium]MDH5303752.1 thermostable hemolysin [Gammaproteobacteria bacterium]MDH5322282.1 thermostable hemolysin [Gammaproteobacteria bacterium]